MQIKWDHLLELLTQPLIDKGFSAEHAEQIASIVLRTMGMGITTHGVRPWFATLDRAEDFAKDQTLNIVEAAPAFAVIHASEVAPQIAMDVAVKEAIKRAEKYGIGTVGVNNAGWVGALAPYMIEALSHGTPCTITGQSVTCADCPPVGGLDPLFSTNPIAFSYGTLETGMVADFSTAAISMGKTNQLIHAGEQAPDKWYREKDGTWTADPMAMKREGSMAFTGGQHGGHRGYAMSLWTEAMAVWAGGKAHGGENAAGQNLMVTAYASNLPHVVTSEIARLHELVYSNRHEDPTKPIRIPGERALKQLADAKINGVRISKDEQDLLLKAGVNL